jgi:hypothetical protein
MENGKGIRYYISIYIIYIYIIIYDIRVSTNLATNGYITGHNDERIQVNATTNDCSTISTVAASAAARTCMPCNAHLPFYCVATTD